MLYMYDSIEIQSIIMAVKNLKMEEDSSKDILLKSIDYLKNNYTMFQKKEFMQKALWHIYAYLEMGFPYNEGKEVFREILDYYQVTENDLILKTQYNNEKVALNKTNIRNLLGRWNPVLHSMKIEDVVNDIIYKASKKIEGEYIYHCGKIVEMNTEKILWEHTFKLFVGKEDILFHDVNRNKYYVFEEKK